MPSPEEFRKNVEEYEGKHGISDCIYEECIREFSDIMLSQVNKKHEIRVIKPFFLGWGKMGRVLGHRGVEAIRKELSTVNEKIEPLRGKDLFLTDIHEIKDLIIDLFDKIRETTFTSKKGKRRKVGLVATSKALHLTCPNLFMMWDTGIRIKYGKKRGDGKEYFEFLCGMKCMGEKLKGTIKELQQKYGKRATKVIDQHNWIESRKNKK